MKSKEAIMILESIQPSCGEKYQFSESEIYEALDMAIEALESQDRQAIIAGSYLLEDTCVAQKRRYTFGNDGFSLESAYHDCKLVFDGITDDDSFQEADTGLILYYANEIIYALHEAMSCSESPNSSGVVSRQAAIDVIRAMQTYKVFAGDDMLLVDQAETMTKLMMLPSAKPEKGEWLPMFNGEFTGGAYWFSCSRCKRIVPEVRNGGWNFCPSCGSDMR